MMRAASGSAILKSAFAFGMAMTPASGVAEETRKTKFGLSYVTDVFANLDGGLDEGSAWLGRADATFEANDLFGIEGTKAFVDIIYTHGPVFSGTRVGDAQVVSNVQGDGILRPYEAYVELPVGAGLSAKAGLVDLNTEFDVQRVGAFFTNSSHGIGIDFSQSGANGPSIFPVTSAAAMVRWDSDKARVRVGLFNAVSGDPDRPRRIRIGYPGRDGSLLVAQTDFDLGGSTRVQIGAWTYTAAQPIIGGLPDETSKGSKGAHGLVEVALKDGLDIWGRVGTANASNNRVTGYLGGGITYGTDEERIGFAVAHARQSGRAARTFVLEEGPQDKAETSFEIGYAHQVTDFLAVQPVVHYVVNPGWRSDVPDALVAGVRFALAFER